MQFFQSHVWRFLSVSRFTLIPLLLAPQAGAIEPVWRFEVSSGHPDGSPAIADVDGDGAPNVVFTTTAGSVIALDGEGFMLWRWDGEQAFSLGPTAADVTGDAALEVLVQSNRGRVSCLDGATGNLIWEADLLGKLDWGMSAIVVADVDGDGTNEIIASDSAGALICVDGAGRTIWTKHEAGSWTSCPAVGDLDNDGRLEILIGSGDSPLVCVSGNGEELWRLPSQGAAWTSPVIWDLDGDGTLEIVTGIGAGLAVVNGQGEIQWRYATHVDIDAAISVGDADQDGNVEIYAVDLSGQLVCVSPKGELHWEAHVEQRSRRSPTLADIDSDGMIEILVGGYSEALHVFDSKGNLEQRIALGGATNASPTVTGLLQNGRLQVICAVTSRELRVYQWPNGNDQAPEVQWGEYRYGSARTASSIPDDPESNISLVKADHGDAYVGANTYTVRIHNPERKTIAIELAVQKNGAAAASNTLASSDEIVECALPYTIRGRSPVHVDFFCTVTNDDSIVLENHRAEYVAPFARELMASERALQSLTAKLPGLRKSDDVKTRLDYFGARLPEYRERASVASALTSEEHRQLVVDLDAMRTECARWSAIVNLATSSHAEQGVVLSSANPWAPFGGMEEAVEGRVQNADLLIESFQDEIEATALNVFNAQGSEVTLRVSIDDLEHDQTDAREPALNIFTVRSALEVVTETLPIVDALPILGSGGVLAVPSWDGRQIWISSDTSDLAPGRWTTNVKIQVERPEPFEIVAPLTLDVWDARVPAKQTIYHCNWGAPANYFGENAQAALEDMIAHRTNVFTDVPRPSGAFDTKGDLIGELDFSEHDAYIQARAPGSLFLFRSWLLSGPAEPFTPVWEKAAVAWLRVWVEHLEEIGLHYDDFALYPIDEPGLTDGVVDEFINYARVAHRADERIQMYANPVGRANMADLKRMAQYVDIWCPERRGYFMGMGEDKLEFMIETGKPVWMFACEGSFRLQAPLGYFRSQTWQAWRLGLEGVGWWNWCNVPDTWARDADYTMVYKRDGVVPSKRWEAVRDGIEDHGLLTLLQQRADGLDRAGENSEDVVAAKRLLREDVAAIATFAAGDEYATIPGVDGLSGMRILSDQRWHAIQNARREIAELLAQLRPRGIVNDTDYVVKGK